MWKSFSVQGGFTSAFVLTLLPDLVSELMS